MRNKILNYIEAKGYLKPFKFKPKESYCKWYAEKRPNLLTATPLECYKERVEEWRAQEAIDELNDNDISNDLFEDCYCPYWEFYEEPMISEADFWKRFAKESERHNLEQEAEIENEVIADLDYLWQADLLEQEEFESVYYLSEFEDEIQGVNSNVNQIETILKKNNTDSFNEIK